MARDKVSQWSSVPASNTDVGGIDIAEGCAPSGINNAIREMMAQVKDMQAGTDGDNFTVGGNLAVTGTTTLTGALTASGGLSGAFNGTVGATTPSTGAFTTLSSTGNTTLGDASGDTLTVNATPTFNVAIPVASGGTGSSTLSANAVLLGNGTSALQTVAPSTSGNVLTSNGTTWTSATPTGGIGDGQTWTNVTSSRAYGTTYTNSTGRPIMVSVSGTSTTASGGGIQFYIGGTLILQQGSTQNDSSASYHNVTIIIPNGVTYSANAIPGGGGQGGSSLQQWFELR